jgi:hypothetical protein
LISTFNSIGGTAGNGITMLTSTIAAAMAIAPTVSTPITSIMLLSFTSFQRNFLHGSSFRVCTTWISLPVATDSMFHEDPYQSTRSGIISNPTSIFLRSRWISNSMKILPFQSYQII